MSILIDIAQFNIFTPYESSGSLTILRQVPWDDLILYEILFPCWLGIIGIEIPQCKSSLSHFSFSIVDLFSSTELVGKNRQYFKVGFPGQHYSLELKAL